MEPVDLRKVRWLRGATPPDGVGQRFGARSVYSNNTLADASFDIVLEIIDQTVRSMAEQTDKYLLEFFGSQEDAIILAPYFVIEYSNPDLVVKDQDMENQSNMHEYVMEQTITIRPKTVDELVADGLINL